MVKKNRLKFDQPCASYYYFDVSAVCCLTLSVSRDNNYRCHGDYWLSYQVTNQAHGGIVLIYQTVLPLPAIE